MELIVYFAMYFAVALVWRTLLVYRSTGINPLTLTSADDAYGYVGRAFKVVITVCGIAVILNAQTASARWLSPISELVIPWLSFVGWILLITSFGWVLIAQAQMGASWRIGIDVRNRTRLIQDGLFHVSRNPIFLSMRVTLLGLFLVVPAAVTLAILVAGDILIQVQVRLEEAHLKGMHGEQYESYQATVRRWL
jgi:protein-S-isoprenylcysteine O-methyltransferase Ste14